MLYIGRYWDSFKAYVLKIFPLTTVNVLVYNLT